jgi:4'-phosphopantetheinyl transferase
MNRMNVEKTGWAKGVPDGIISSNEVHVWRFYQEEINSQIKTLQDILSPDELGRSQKFHFEKDRKRFIIFRAMLRRILSSYLGKNPQQIEFNYTSFGKPFLSIDSENDTISFNLSHSGGVALYAITRNQKIGIDVEQVRDHTDVMAIAKRFFSPGEIGDMEKANGKNHTELFFRYWTRKEAFVKALGKGVSFPMERLDVSLLNKFSSIIKVTAENNENVCLYVQDLFAVDGYAAAIATEANDPEISCWHFCL